MSKENENPMIERIFFLNQKENHPVELTEDWLVYKKVSVNLKAIQ